MSSKGRRGKTSGKSTSKTSLPAFGFADDLLKGGAAADHEPQHDPKEKAAPSATEATAGGASSAEPQAGSKGEKKVSLPAFGFADMLPDLRRAVSQAAESADSEEPAAPAEDAEPRQAPEPKTASTKTSGGEPAAKPAKPAKPEDAKPKAEGQKATTAETKAEAGKARKAKADAESPQAEGPKAKAKTAKAGAGEPKSRGPKEAGSAAAVDRELTGEGRVFAFADRFDDGSEEEAVVPVRLETWLTLELAGETFALPVEPVKEILRISSITRVPHAPYPIRGVTNVRGRIIPVIDLRIRLELPEGEIGRASRVIVVASRGRLLGLLVDAVHQVVHLDLDQVQPPPEDVMTVQSDYIRGVYHLGEELLLLIDVDRVLIIKEAPVTPRRPPRAVATESSPQESA